MKRIILLLGFILLAGASAMAQNDSTRVIDNKGTIKWVIKSVGAIVTKADSTLLYVTPTQLGDSIEALKADTAFLRFTGNGLTKNGQTVELGGALNRATTIETTAANFLAITGLQSGSNTTDSLMVVDPATGQVKFISPTALFNALTFTNGLTKTGNTVKLGGALTEPTTTISTGANTLTVDATGGTLNVTGLTSGDLGTDSLMVVNGATGKVAQVSASDLLTSGETSFRITDATVKTYAVADMPANPSRVWVYRNGAKLIGGNNSNIDSDYTVTAGQVTLVEKNAAAPNDSDNWALQNGDVIEVQWVK